MKNRVAWGLAAGLMGALRGGASAQAQTKAPFVDVPPDHAASAAVADLAGRKLIFGYPDGTFRGERAITRRELAEILWRVVVHVEPRLLEVTGSASHIPTERSTFPPEVFADVPADSELTDILRELTAKGILQGYADGTFRPRRTVTQGELDLVLRRTLEWVAHELSQAASQPDLK